MTYREKRVGQGITTGGLDAPTTDTFSLVTRDDSS